MTKHGFFVSYKNFKSAKDRALTASKDNLRFAFNTCIFAMANATDPITTPCSLDTVCAPIQGAMLDGMDDPETLQEYSYCSAYDNSFLGSFLGICGTCLAESAEESYFSNCTSPGSNANVC
jgi:hypothetical protein